MQKSEADNEFPEDSIDLDRGYLMSKVCFVVCVCVSSHLGLVEVAHKPAFIGIHNIGVESALKFDLLLGHDHTYATLYTNKTQFRRHRKTKMRTASLRKTMVTLSSRYIP